MNYKLGILRASTGIRFAKVAQSHGVSIFLASLEILNPLPFPYSSVPLVVITRETLSRMQPHASGTERGMTLRV